jgi:N6-L-threonylcarbamoyladenine synthase
MKRTPLILAIDTSCDETSVAVGMGTKILSNVIYSQVEIHQPWGGVVPNLARNAHIEHIDQLIEQALARANSQSRRIGLKDRVNLQTITHIAVTQGPGLSIALGVGINKAKELAKEYNKKLIAVNHLEGHLLSSFALNSKGNGPFKNIKPLFPMLGLIVSGGHTQLVLIEDFGKYKVIGKTLDDAAGEAFDKVAKMLGLGYPGGPALAELAKQGDSDRFDLPIPMVKNKGLNFSFSGLKTACLYMLKKIPEKSKDSKFIKDFAASFEKAVVNSIEIKTEKAIKIYHPKQIVMGGGVVNNIRLRRSINKLGKKYHTQIFYPKNKNLITDNAGMIAIAAYYNYQRNNIIKADNLDRAPNLSLD